MLILSSDWIVVFFPFAYTASCIISYRGFDTLWFLYKILLHACMHIAENMKGIQKLVTDTGI